MHRQQSELFEPGTPGVATPLNVDDVIAERAAKRHLARASDPDTSHEGAASLAPKALKGQLHLAYGYVSRYPSRTSRELALIYKHDTGTDDRYIFSKRCADLRDMGLVENGVKRECEVTGCVALTWFVPIHRGQA